MAMVVKNNMSAVNTLNTLNKNQSALGKSLAKVSSGMKINSAQDDASGYAISERMRVMVRALDQANANTQNGSSLMKTAEGAVSNTVELLKTLKEKAINAATDTNTEEDRAIIQKEINQLVDQIDDNALITFNGKNLLDGSKTAAGVATRSSWTNQALAEDTTGLTKLTNLKARNGEALTIEKTDNVTISYVQNGKTYVTNSLVGDLNLNNIFQLAEDADKSSTVFANASTEDFQKAGGVITFGNSDAEAISNAIGYLKSALAIKNSVGVTAADLNSGSTVLKIKADTGVYNAGTGSVDALELDKDTEASLVPTGTDLGINASYDGEIYKELRAAVDAYNNVINEIGGYTPDATNPLTAAGTGVGTAYYLGEALRNSGISWTGAESDLHALKSKIEEAGGAALKFYQQYQEAAAQRDGAKANLDAALEKYNSNVLQLDSLIRLQDYETAKTNYRAAVDQYINEITVAMNNDSGADTYTLPAGVAGNTDALTYNPSQDTGNTKAEKISAIADAVKNKLLDILDSASLPTAENFTAEVKALINNDTDVKLGFHLATSAGKAVGTPDNVIGVASDSSATPPTSATGAEAVVEAATALKDDKAVLETAYKDSLAPYIGPALLTGSNVGLDPAGKVVTTLDGTAGLTFMSAQTGIKDQISGFTISISDSQGNVRKSVNTSLNSWSTTVYAKEASTKDHSLVFQIGTQANQSISVDLADMRAQALGLKGKDGKVVDVSTKENANAAISVFENALQKALDVQTTIGAIEARLEYTASNLTTSSENVQAAESTIRDADMAKEMTNYTKNNVLLQAAQSMLAQANQNSSAVLSLLQ